MTKTQIRELLDRLVAEGVVVDYVLQSRMPGLRWTLYLPSFQGKKMFTTGELRVWISGVVAGSACPHRLYVEPDGSVDSYD